MIDVLCRLTFLTEASSFLPLSPNLLENDRISASSVSVLTFASGVAALVLSFDFPGNAVVAGAAGPEAGEALAASRSAFGNERRSHATYGAPRSRY